jgi:hypothetical protein
MTKLRYTQCIASLLLLSQPEPNQQIIKRGEKNISVVCCTRRRSDSIRIITRSFCGSAEQKRGNKIPISFEWQQNLFIRMSTPIFHVFLLPPATSNSRGSIRVLIGAPIKNNNRRDEYAKEKRGRIHPLTSWVHRIRCGDGLQRMRHSK